MTATWTPNEREALAARLATTAYEVALRHGIKGSFVDLELKLWREMKSLCNVADDRTEGHC